MKRNRYEAPEARELARIILTKWRDESLAHDYGYDDVMDVRLHLYNAQRLTPRPWVVTFGDDTPNPTPDHTAHAEILLGRRPDHRAAERIAYNLLEEIRDQLTTW